MENGKTVVLELYDEDEARSLLALMLEQGILAGLSPVWSRSGKTCMEWRILVGTEHMEQARDFLDKFFEAGGFVDFF